MDESDYEKSVGDIVVRQRKIREVLKEDTGQVAYGPLTLVVEDGYVIVSDFDGRVYNPIKIPEKPLEEKVQEVMSEVDPLVEQAYNEL